MKRAMIAATVYFMVQFALGSVLGTSRVLPGKPCGGHYGAVANRMQAIIGTANN